MRETWPPLGPWSDLRKAIAIDKVSEDEKRANGSACLCWRYGKLHQLRVGENIDWALKPNAIYRRSGGTAIGTTNGRAIFTSQLENSIGATSIYVWTGLSANWQDTGMSCSAWIDNTGGVLGTVGDSLSPHSTAISTTANTCSAAAPLYCVEQ